MLVTLTKSRDAVMSNKKLSLGTMNVFLTSFPRCMLSNRDESGSNQNVEKPNILETLSAPTQQLTNSSQLVR